jgi:hypothetical protein
MRIETKLLRLPIPVEVGSWFGDWRVTWVGGWTKHHLSFLVVVAKLPPATNAAPGASDKVRVSS